MTTKHKLITGLLGALLALGAAAAPAAAQDAGTAAERRSVELLLNAYDRPATADQYKAAAQHPEAILLDLALDPTQRSRVRRAALGALSRFPSPAVRSLYSQLLKEAALAPTASLEAHTAILNAMAAFGADMAPEVLSLLAHPDVQVRLSVVTAVAKHGGDAARQHLRDHAAHEPDPAVLAAIRDQAAVLR